jgi:hypothetical protein
LTWTAALVLFASIGIALLSNGRSGTASLWLDGDLDPLSSQLSLFVSGSCDPDGEQVRSVSVRESPDAVVVEVQIRWPMGLGTPSCGSYEGTPYVVRLEQPLGDRQVYALNPDSSRSLVLPSPFTD